VLITDVDTKKYLNYEFTHLTSAFPIENTDGIDY
jgi:hypothetical protein